MQRIMKISARGVIVLGTAALLLSGVPALANPDSGAVFPENQPRLLAQSKTPPGDVEQPAKGRSEEPKPKAADQAQPDQPRKEKKAKMRGAVPERDSSGSKRFGAGVIRKNEKPVDEE